ncbi:hypothetical protein SH139x_005738 [Planctomycetaceae bacterium SH139]
MDLRKWVQQTAEYGYNSVAGGLGIAGAGVGYVTELVGNLKVFGSTTISDAEQKYDERHYLLVPDARSDDGYSLVVTRCLPDGVPPINQLPKRRVLHLPAIEAETMLRTLLIRQAQAEELDKPSQGRSMGDRARELADYIDELDDRVFGGVLLIGGLVAIFNPVAGAAIAAKSLIPSLGMLASKYGLRVAEESLNQADVKRRVKQAEKEVLSQFRGSQTKAHVNQVLAITDRALRTNEEEFDPLLEMHAILESGVTAEENHMLRLAGAAVLDVFDTAICLSNEATRAGLGPEDLRFMKVLQSFVGAEGRADQV